MTDNLLRICLAIGAFGGGLPQVFAGRMLPHPLVSGLEKGSTAQLSPRSRKMDEDNNQRSEPRDSVFMRANLTGKMVEMSVTVRNLSSRGAMIAGAGCGPVGSEVTLHLHNIGDVHGTVAWARDDNCGIRFSHPIDPHLARRQMPSGNFGRATQFVTPPKRRV